MYEILACAGRSSTGLKSLNKSKRNGNFQKTYCTISFSIFFLMVGLLVFNDRKTFSTVIGNHQCTFPRPGNKGQMSDPENTNKKTVPHISRLEKDYQSCKHNQREGSCAITTTNNQFDIIYLISMLLLYYNRQRYLHILFIVTFTVPWTTVVKIPIMVPPVLLLIFLFVSKVFLIWHSLLSRVASF